MRIGLNYGRYIKAVRGKLGDPTYKIQLHHDSKTIEPCFMCDEAGALYSELCLRSFLSFKRIPSTTRMRTKRKFRNREFPKVIRYALVRTRRVARYDASAHHEGDWNLIVPNQ
jgi:hypothetical protein